MNNRNKILYALLLLTTGLHADQQAIASAPITEQAQIDSLQDPIALNIIKAMQDCITRSGQLHLKLKSLQAPSLESVQSENDLWAKATQLYGSYISELRARYNNITRPELKNLTIMNGNADIVTQLTIQANQAQSLFTRLLDEYIAHLGKVHEKNSGIFGLYKNSYYISSAHDQTLPITPNEYPLLIEVLNRAAQQKEWEKTVDFKLPVIQENGSVVIKSLNLQEIISGITNVPLPAQYSTAAKIGMGVAAATALGAGAYLAYQAYDTSPIDLATIQEDTQNIENALNIAPTTENNIIVPAAETVDHNAPDNNRPYDIISVKADDGIFTSVGKSMINDITNLPADIANRAKTTWENMSSGNYKPGETTKKLMENSVQVAENYAYDGVTPSLEDAALQSFDDGDSALVHTAGTLLNTHVMGTLAKSAGNKMISKVGDKITSNIAQGATQGVKNAGTYGMSEAAIAESQAANRAADITATKAVNQTGLRTTTGVAGALENATNNISNFVKPRYNSAKNYITSGNIANAQADQARQYARTTAQGYAATQGSAATMQEGGRYTLSNVRATQAAADAATKKASQTGLNPIIESSFEYGAAAVPAVALAGTAQAAANINWNDLADVSSPSDDANQEDSQQLS